MMTKIVYLGLIAIIVLLVGATAVFAQDQITGPGFGGRMMQAPGDGTTTPGPGPGSMMNGANWEDMQQRHDSMGQYMQGTGMEEMHNAMGEAMKSGDFQKMQDTCQSFRGGDTPEDTGDQPQTPPATTRGGSMMRSW